MARRPRAVAVFSGGLDSVCMCAHLSGFHELHGITFSYGQRAAQEVRAARRLARRAGLVEHRTVDISFMRGLYAGTNVLTDSRSRLPGRFDYSIVVPVRNAVFLSIASAWAFTIGARTVAYGAHTGDRPYPDCRPAFSRALEAALNAGESDGIRSKKRLPIRIWSPASEGLSKAEMVRRGHAAPALALGRRRAPPARVGVRQHARLKERVDPPPLAALGEALWLFHESGPLA